MDNTNFDRNLDTNVKENNFKKNDLKLYDILETRNGSIYIVLWDDGLVLLNTDTAKYLTLKGYDDDLYYTDNEDYDILRIKTPKFLTDAFRLTGMCIDCKRSAFDWDSAREEEVVEMTLRDLNRLLGYRVRIID